MSMQLIDAVWTKSVNLLVILCACGKTFQHRSDRWTVRCGVCQRSAHLGKLRDEFMRRNLGC
jgi:hypothetical protein